MTDRELPPPVFFSQTAEVSKSVGDLPHWNQRGCTVFVTWRMADAIPQQKLAEWQCECEEWRKAHPEFMEEMLRRRGGLESSATKRRVEIEEDQGFDVAEVSRPPQSKITRISDQEYLRCSREYAELRECRLQHWLDQGMGGCVLKRAELRKIVEDSLRGFDGIRYVLYAYVVMPNHVHALLMPVNGFDLNSIVAGVKKFTARRINSALGRSGTFWQRETYDHLVRNERQFAKYLSYIKANDGDKAYDAYEAMRGQSEMEAKS